MKIWKTILLMVTFTTECSEKQRAPSPPSDEEQHERIYKRVIDLLDEIDSDEIQYDEINCLDYIKTMPQTPLPPTPIPERKKRTLNESSNNIQR